MYCNVVVILGIEYVMILVVVLIKVIGESVFVGIYYLLEKNGVSVLLENK